MKEEFMECDTCRAKPGSPVLCLGCVHNSILIERLLEKLKTFAFPQKGGKFRAYTYSGIHQHLNEQYPKKGICLHCKESRKTDYALLQGRMYSRDISDYIELCKPCHRKYDFNENIKQNMSRGQTGVKKPWLQVKVVAIYPDGSKRVFDSVTKAAEAVGTTRVAVSNVLNGRAATSKRVRFEYAELLAEMMDKINKE